MRFSSAVFALALSAAGPPKANRADGVVSTPMALGGDGGAPSGVPACIAISSESRYVPYGYHHIVILKSGCSKAARCVVSTDVNPEPQTVELPAASTVEVVTYQGAAARAFTPRVGCQLH